MENWRNLPKLGSVQAVSHKEAFDLMRPCICEMCRRWFHPTEEEKKEGAEYVANMDFDFEWKIVIPNKNG